MQTTTGHSIDDMGDFFQHMQEFFPRMNGTAAVIGVWHETLRGYSKAVIYQAFKRFVQTKERQPSLMDMSELCSSFSPRDTREEVKIEQTADKIREGRGAWRPKTKMEICLDTLGPELVTGAIAEVVLQPRQKTSDFKWAMLVSCRDWIVRYRLRLDELYEMARHMHAAPECKDLREEVTL
jgi:hypothetical protein